MTPQIKDNSYTLTTETAEQKAKRLQKLDKQIAECFMVTAPYVTLTRLTNPGHWEMLERQFIQDGKAIIESRRLRKQISDKSRADDEAQWDAIQDWDADGDPPTWHEKAWRLSQWLTPAIISVLLWITLYLGGSFALHHLISRGF
jgi:hypothetical protein